MIILWSPNSDNVKTGDVPTAWVGASKEETRASCAGCKLAPREEGGDGTCYAWSGTPAIARASITKAAARGADRSLERALAERRADARMVRVSALGDAGRAGAETAARIVAKVAAAGLALVGYTHHWREEDVAAAWRGRLMASVETLAQADEAAAAGWRAAAVVPEDYPRTGTTPAGRRVVVCPAQVAEGTSGARPVTCNTCRLCDAARPGPVIAFREHGNGTRRAKREAAAAARKAERAAELAARVRGALWSEVRVFPRAEK
jgi:hypothetical protein